MIGSNKIQNATLNSKANNGTRSNVKGSLKGGSFITPKVKYHGKH